MENSEYCWIPLPNNLSKSQPPYLKAQILHKNPQASSFIYKFLDHSLNQESQEAHISSLIPHFPIQPPYSFSNLLDLPYINIAEILNNLRTRYENSQIHTNLGNSLLIINPNKPLNTEYSSEKLNFFASKLKTALISNYFDESNEPHIYSKAAFAYFSLTQTKRNQAILIHGIAGSGKTENTKFAMKFLASLKNNDSNSNEISIEQKILSCIPILEAFGNAKTLNNSNSSRFGKFIRILFEKSESNIQGGAISSYLFEKSRVSSHANYERNYHIFYQILTGLSIDEKMRYFLEEKNNFDDFCYLKNTISDEKDQDFDNYQLLIESFKKINITNEELEAIISIILSILYLGNLEFLENSHNDKPCEISSDFWMKKLVNLLKLDYESFLENLLYKTRTIEKEMIKSPLSRLECMGIRDSLSRGMYDQLFNWLVKRLNLILIPKNDVDESISLRKSMRFLRKSLNNPSCDKLAIGILDIFGFENLDFNGFEQFCINFFSEKLHQMYLIETFKLENRFFNEELSENYNFEVDFHDNQSLLELFEKFPLGIFELLDESTALVSNDDKKLLEKIIKIHKDHINFITPKAAFEIFGINHNGIPVDYNILGFRSKNKDEIPKKLQETIEESQNSLISNIFKGFCGFEAEKLLDYKKKFKEKNAEKGFGATNKTDKFLCAKFRAEIRQLIEELNTYDVNFVRCLKGNIGNSDIFENNTVLSQIKALEILETVKIRKEGFYYKKKYSSFLKEFGVLIKVYGRKNVEKYENNYEDLKEKSRVIVKKLKKDEVLLGNTRVFIKYEGLKKLEGELRDLRSKMAKKIIKNISKWRIQRKKKKIEGFEEKIGKFQRVWRKKKNEMKEKSLEDKGKMKEIVKELKEIKEEKGDEEGLEQKVEKMEKILREEKEVLEKKNEEYEVFEKKNEEFEKKTEEFEVVEKKNEEIAKKSEVLYDDTGNSVKESEVFEKKNEEIKKNEEFEVVEKKNEEFEVLEKKIEDFEVLENKEEVSEKKDIKNEEFENSKNIETTDSTKTKKEENITEKEVLERKNDNLEPFSGIKNEVFESKNEVKEEDKEEIVPDNGNIKEDFEEIIQEKTEEKNERNTEKNALFNETKPEPNQINQENFIEQQSEITEEITIQEENQINQENFIKQQGEIKEEIIIEEENQIKQENLIKEEKNQEQFRKIEIKNIEKSIKSEKSQNFEDNLNEKFEEKIINKEENTEKIETEKTENNEEKTKNKEEKLGLDQKIKPEKIDQNFSEENNAKKQQNELKLKELYKEENEEIPNNLSINKEVQEKELVNKNQIEIDLSHEVPIKKNDDNPQINIEKPPIFSEEIDKKEQLSTDEIQEEKIEKEQIQEISMINQEKKLYITEKEEIKENLALNEKNIHENLEEKEAIQENLSKNIEKIQENIKEKEDLLKKTDEKEEIQEILSKTFENQQEKIDDDLPKKEEFQKNLSKNHEKLLEKEALSINAEISEENQSERQKILIENPEKIEEKTEKQMKIQNENRDNLQENAANSDQILQKEEKSFEIDSEDFKEFEENLSKFKENPNEFLDDEEKFLQKVQDSNKKSVQYLPEILEIEESSLIESTHKKEKLIKPIFQSETPIITIVPVENPELIENPKEFIDNSSKEFNEKPMKSPEILNEKLFLQHSSTQEIKPKLSEKTLEFLQKTPENLQKSKSTAQRPLNSMFSGENALNGPLLSARVLIQSSDFKLEAEIEKLSLEKSLRKSMLLSPRELTKEALPNETLVDSINEFINEEENLDLAIKSSKEIVEILNANSKAISFDITDYKANFSKETSLLDLFLPIKTVKSNLTLNSSPFCSDLNININKLDAEFLKNVLSNPFLQFCEKYLPKKTTWSGKVIPMQDLLCFSKGKLQFSLTLLKKTNEKIAKISFKIIQDYLLEKEEEKRLYLAKELIELGFSNELEIRNEIFFQILKQTYKNPFDNLLLKAYVLLLLFSSFFAPSHVFIYAFLQNLYTSIQTNQKNDEHMIIRALNKACFMRILRISIVGDRKMVPRIQELKILTRIKKIIVQIILPNNWDYFISIPIEPYTTIYETKVLLLKFLNLEENTSFFGLFAMINRNGVLEEIFLNDEEKYMDILNDLELQKEDFEQRVTQGKKKGFNKLWFFDYRIMLKIRIFFKLFENDLDLLNFYYIQHQGDLINNKFPVNEEDLYDLLTISFLISYDNKLDDALEEKTISKLLPKGPKLPNIDKILEIVQFLKGKFEVFTKKELKMKFIEILRKYDGFMAHDFMVNYYQIDKGVENNKGYLRMAIRPLQVFFINGISSKTLFSYDFSEIKNWEVNKEVFLILDTKDGVKHICETNQAVWMEYLLRNYSKMAMKKEG